MRLVRAGGGGLPGGGGRAGMLVTLQLGEGERDWARVDGILVEVIIMMTVMMMMILTTTRR